MSGVRARSGGRNRLSTVQKKLRGTLRKSRLRPKRPALALAVPDPPPWLAKAAHAHYWRLAALAELARIVTLIDGDAIALAAVALAELEEADARVRRDGMFLTRVTENGQVLYRHPAVVARADAWRRANDLLRSLGLNPQTRESVAAFETPARDDAEARFFFDGALPWKSVQ